MFKNDKNKICVIFNKKLAFYNDERCEMINIKNFNSISKNSKIKNLKDVLYMECDLKFNSKNNNESFLFPEKKIFKLKNPIFSQQNEDILYKDKISTKFDKIQNFDLEKLKNQSSFEISKIGTMKTFESIEVNNLIEQKKFNNFNQKNSELNNPLKCYSKSTKIVKNETETLKISREKIKNSEKSSQNIQSFKNEKNVKNFEKKVKLLKNMKKEDLEKETDPKKENEKDQKLLHLKFYRKSIYISQIKINNEIFFRDESLNFENLKTKILKDKKKKTFEKNEVKFIISNYHFLYYLKIPKKKDSLGNFIFLEFVGKIKKTISEHSHKNQIKGKLKKLENLYRKHYLSFDYVNTSLFFNFELFIAKDHSSLSFAIDTIGEFTLSRN